MEKKIFLAFLTAILIFALMPFSAFAADDGKPVASPKGGTIYVVTEVKLTSSIATAEIRWTTDGSEPTNKSALYTKPIEISSTTTLKAKAFWTALGIAVTSPTMTEKYTYVDSTPKAEPSGGTYNSAQTVKLSTVFPNGNNIYYTIDGSDPTSSSTRKIYNEPIKISKSTTLKAACISIGSIKGKIMTEEYYISQGQCAKPTIKPSGGTYDAPLKITLACPTDDAIIWYLLADGDPRTDDNAVKYTGPFEINNSTTISVCAMANFHTPSDVVKATYLINKPSPKPDIVSAPVASPKGGTYDKEQIISLSCPTAGAEIFYTLDGTKPNSSSYYYTEPIRTSLSITVNAIAIKNGISSPVMTEKYIIEDDIVEPAKIEMVFTLDKPTYYIDGIPNLMDVSPVSVENRTVLPIRYVAEPLGAIVQWDDATRKVTVILDSTKIELWIGSNTAKVNGKNTSIDPENPNVKPIILNNRTMLPMRFVAETLGCNVEWIDASREIHVTYPK